MAPTQMQGGTQIPLEAPKKAFSRFKDISGNLGNTRRAVTGKIPSAVGKAAVTLATAQAMLTLGYCTNAGFTDKKYLKAFSDSLWVLKGTYIALRKTGAFALKTGETAISYGVAALKALAHSPAIAGGIFTAAMTYWICKKALKKYHSEVLDDAPLGKKLASAAGAISCNLGKIAVTGYAASVLMTVKLSDIYYLLSHNPRVDHLAKQVLDQLSNPTLPYALAVFSAGFAINGIAKPIYNMMRGKRPPAQKEKSSLSKPDGSSAALNAGQEETTAPPELDNAGRGATGAGFEQQELIARLGSETNPIVLTLEYLRADPKLEEIRGAVMDKFMEDPDATDVKFMGSDGTCYVVPRPLRRT